MDNQNINNSLEITPEYLFLNRRQFIKKAFWISAFLSLPLRAQEYIKEKVGPVTPEDIATSYNNFYEFSLDKEEVKKKVEGQNFVHDWKIEVTGLVEQKKTYTLEQLVALAGPLIEERVYRFRCVEGWSMIVPWRGFPLRNLIEKLKPNKSATFIKFVTFSDKKMAPNLSGLSQYPWPYTEGLTMEEAMHPLTFVATGMYGKVLPQQNGAPLRLVVPWKYGFKSIKSIVKIDFTNERPKTFWNLSAPNEYGFYANVNPKVDHPRWSQATERVLDKSFFPKRQPTLMFNGYEKEVEHLYKGLDLAKNF